MAMNSSIGLGGQVPGVGKPGNHLVEIVTQRPLQKLLAFRHRSIDDVVNSPLVKNEIRAYWKMHKQIYRQIEIGELERQWNAIPL